MVKYCLEKYPKGSWKGQKSDGRFIDGWLYKNLDLLSDKISKDMTFLAVIYSSTLEVGTGKSVMATQIGECWTEMVNRKYNLNVPYNVENIVWRPKDLIKKAFKMPKYSFILLDEWEDAGYWSELGMTLREFFRKCRQLNLFIMIIIPNWFQLPLNYAVSRSVFAIDVKFDNNLDRGNFSFYNFLGKRMLYINGKRQHNYRVARPSFSGKFPDGYGVDEKEYRKRKMEDMLEYDKENPKKLSKSQIETNINSTITKRLSELHPELSSKELAEVFNVTRTSINRWKSSDGNECTNTQDNYNNEQKDFEQKIVVVNEEELEATEKMRGGVYDPKEVGD